MGFVTLVRYGDGPGAIFDMIKERILSGELQSGSELKIQALAKQLEVSIVPVREAIRMLAADNLIELRPRRSPVVATIDAGELVEINQIRLALEPMVLASAIPNHTPQTILDCHRILERDEASDDMWEKVALNRRFHMALLSPSPLKRTLRIIEEQFDGISRVVQFIVVDRGVFLGHLHHEHMTILKAVENKNSDDAVALLHHHITVSTERARMELAKREAVSTSAET